jgi:hypothetical protein
MPVYPGARTSQSQDETTIEITGVRNRREAYR